MTPTVSDLGDQEVWTATGANSASGPRVVHTDEDCKFLAQANDVRSWPASHFTDDRRVCQYCTGEAEPAGVSGYGLWQTLEEMDPEELGGGAA